MAKVTLGYPSLSAAIRALTAQGVAVDDIARTLGVSPSIVRVGLRYQPGDWSALSRTARKALRPAAEARGLTIKELALRLLECVAADGLIDAILDDADG